MTLRWILAALVLPLAACGDGGSDAGQQGQGTKAVYGALPETEKAPVEAAASGYGKAKPKKSSSGDFSFGDQMLSFPEDLQMIMLSYRATGQEPPLEKWANENYLVGRADEFSKASVLQAEIDRLASTYADTKNVGRIELRNNTNFSQYDSARGGYYIPTFSPGNVYNFNAYKESISLQIMNSDDAYFWPMDANAAKALLQSNPYRALTVDMVIDLTGVERRSSGILFKGAVREYRIYNNIFNNKNQLAHIVVP